MKWKEIADATNNEGIFKAMVPEGLELKKGDKIFTIGSCFAREIEDALSDTFAFPTFNYHVKDRESYTTRARGIFNKFTPESMLRELDWLQALTANHKAFDLVTKDYFAYDLGGDQTLDIGLHRTMPVSSRRFIERRRDIFNIYKEISTSDAVVVTLGNLEQYWLEDGRALESISTNKNFLKAESRALSVKKQNEDDVLEVVGRLIGIIREINQQAKIILTVSPVPMERTEFDRHIIVENFSNKFTLVRAAKHWTEKTGNSFYFPSFEMVTFLGLGAFREDLRHVKPEVVKMIMMSFLGSVLP